MQLPFYLKRPIVEFSARPLPRSNQPNAINWIVDNSDCEQIVKTGFGIGNEPVSRISKRESMKRIDDLKKYLPYSTPNDYENKKKDFQEVSEKIGLGDWKKYKHSE